MLLMLAFSVIGAVYKCLHKIIVISPIEMRSAFTVSKYRVHVCYIFIVADVYGVHSSLPE